MLVVPSNDSLSVEVRVPSSDIDQLKIGRRGILLRFTAFNQRTTPEVKGVLTRLSPDAVPGQGYGTILLHGSHRAKTTATSRCLQTKKLVPGMPAEAFIETASSRTALSYLTKPPTQISSSAPFASAERLPLA